MVKVGDQIPMDNGEVGTVVHVSPTSPKDCDHDWPEDKYGADMNGCCTKCGMSFIRYIHTDCP
jgi:hypothetical protein